MQPPPDSAGGRIRRLGRKRGRFHVPLVLMTQGTLAHKDMETIQGLSKALAERGIASLAHRMRLIASQDSLQPRVRPICARDGRIQPCRSRAVCRAAPERRERPCSPH